MADQLVLVITGTSRGIGRALAERYLARGYLVAGCSRAAIDLDAPGYRHTIVDLSDEDQVRAWIRTLYRDCGRIDGLIASAALAPAAMMSTMTPGSMIDSVLRTNVAGTFFVCREVSKTMLRQRSGKIITFASMAVSVIESGTAIYAASKSAVVTMTKVMARELAPAGITCNIIAPSMVETDALEALGPVVRERISQRLAIPRALDMNDIGNAVDFFLSDASSAVTGQLLNLGIVE
jgi:3-oxoacyl-[acyl-carrier protein] reductase